MSLRGAFPSKTFGSAFAILIAPAILQASILYLSDSGSGNIFAFTPDGVRSTFASGLNHPSGLAFDGSGNLYAADGPDIFKFTPGGDKSTFASGLTSPEGLAFDSAGNLYVADGPNIFQFTPDGVRSIFFVFTFIPGANVQVSDFGLAFDAGGNLYLSNIVNFHASLAGDIFKFDPSGMVQSTFASGICNPTGLTFDVSGNLYAASSHTGLICSNVDSIFQFTPGGIRNTLASGLSGPIGLAFDSSGNLFATDGGSILEFAPDGAQTTFASGLNTPGFLAFAPPVPSVPEPGTFRIVLIAAAAFVLRSHLLPRGQTALRGFERRKTAAFLFDQIKLHAALTFGGRADLRPR